MDGGSKGIKWQRSARCRGLVLYLGLGISAAPQQVQAAADPGRPAVQLRAAQVPLAVDGADGSFNMSVESGDSPGDEVADHLQRSNMSDRTEYEPSEATTTGPPPPRIDPEALPLQIAIGLGPSAPGSREELAIVRSLEASVTASSAPRTSVRRLHGGGQARSVCRQRRDDLVLTVGYIADRDEAVLLTYDCALDRALGIRPSSAAAESGLVGALWSEHRSLVQQGAKLRRAPLVSRRTRKILIAGGATALLGVALGLILASTLRPTTVVLTVGR